jgi:thiamine transport system ATP-binding protein
MLDMAGLGPFARRYRTSLWWTTAACGACQALAPRPAVLLLDEPFSHLDADLHTQMPHEVYVILRHLETTAVFVTHDHEEAFMVADRVEF